MKKKFGFFLFEILTAFFIFSIISLGLLHLTIITHLINKEVLERSKALNIVYNYFEGQRVKNSNIEINERVILSNFKICKVTEHYNNKKLEFLNGYYT